MKKVALCVVGLIALGAAYVAGSFNAKTTISIPDAEWAAGSTAAQAWRELLVSVEAAGEKIYAATDDPIERLEGLKYLQDLLAGSVEMKVTKGDAAFPAFTDWMGDDRKYLGDSPDAVYHTAEISGEYSYEVTGVRADAEYLAFVIYGRGINGWNKVSANLSNQDMVLGANGEFKILLSETRPDNFDGNWLPLQSDSHMIMVRQYFHDRSRKEEARFDIRNLEPIPHTVSNDASLAQSIRNATEFFNDSLNGTLALGAMVAEKPNTSEPPKAYNQDFGGIFYPTPDNQYFGTGFEIAPDEALVIEGDVPDVDYWSVSLQNRWLQSLDYENYQVSLTDQDIIAVDGRYRVVVSHENPGVDNWLDVAGHETGLLAIRYQLAPSLPSPDIRLVKLSELSSK